MYKKTLSQQFWPKVSNTENVDECWVWTGAKNKAGYGNMKVNGKYVNSHRVSYEMHKGEVPEGYYVCHKCDNPSCVNPDHLFLGTPRENDLDKVSKKRHLYGENHPMSKLSQEEVLTIRGSAGTQEDIAKKFNVSRRLVGMIRNGNIWKCVAE